MSFGYQVLGFGSEAAGPAVYDAAYLIVAGGGGGGKDACSVGYAGGGGAGGYRTNYGGTAISLTVGVEYTIVVGAGGAAWGSAGPGGRVGYDGGGEGANQGIATLYNYDMFDDTEENANDPFVSRYLQNQPDDIREAIETKMQDYYTV